MRRRLRPRRHQGVPGRRSTHITSVGRIATTSTETATTFLANLQKTKATAADGCANRLHFSSFLKVSCRPQLRWRSCFSKAVCLRTALIVPPMRHSNFHHWRPRISGRGYARMEQPAVQRHLVDVIDSFQAAPQNRAFLAMFWPGPCLTIFLSFLCIMFDSERVLSIVK